MNRIATLQMTWFTLLLLTTPASAGPDLLETGQQTMELDLYGGLRITDDVQDVWGYDIYDDIHHDAVAQYGLGGGDLSLRRTVMPGGALGVSWFVHHGKYSHIGSTFDMHFGGERTRFTIGLGNAFLGNILPPSPGILVAIVRFGLEGRAPLGKGAALVFDGGFEAYSFWHNGPDMGAGSQGLTRRLLLGSFCIAPEIPLDGGGHLALRPGPMVRGGIHRHFDYAPSNHSTVVERIDHFVDLSFQVTVIARP